MKPSALEKEIAELDAQIEAGAPDADLNHGGRAITARQAIQNRIGSAARDLKNYKEAADILARRVAEEQQQLAEMRAFTPVAKAAINDARFSSRRLELAIQADDPAQFAWGLCAIDETVDGLQWWVDNHESKIARKKSAVTKLEKLLDENRDLAARAERSLSDARAELAAHDRIQRAENEAARQIRGGDLDGSGW